MKRRLAFILLASAGVLAALIGTAGAGSMAAASPSAHPVHLTNVAAIKKYLRAHHINTAGLVVQHGTKNYAGPSCPGRGWTCTKAKRVIQMTTNDSTSSNVFFCSRSYGTPTIPPTYPPAPTGAVACTIVQVNAGSNNSANCTIASTKNPVTEYCAIHQENTTGANDAFIAQAAFQKNQAHQDANLQAYVEQFNGLGRNTLLSGQLIDQDSTQSGVIDQQQTPRISLRVNQQAASGKNSAAAAQAVDDDQTATGALSAGTQSQNSDLSGQVEQNSVNVSSTAVLQNESLNQVAPQGSAVDQTQIGPLFCCQTQTGNDNDNSNVNQRSVLRATSPTASQETTINGHCVSQGTCNINELASTNADTQTNSCTSTGLGDFSCAAIGIDCISASEGEGTGACFPFSEGGGGIGLQAPGRRAAKRAS